MEKVINKTATIQNILNWASAKKIETRAINQFNEFMKKDNWEFILIRTANLCQVEIIYM
ncbi:MAG: hypothetical protein WCO66_03575 [Candidatus Absconditabacteria bacterium]